jgi:hypothetical protein
MREPTATRISATAGSTSAAEKKRVITYTYKQKPATERVLATAKNVRYNKYR